MESVYETLPSAESLRKVAWDASREELEKLATTIGGKLEQAAKNGYRDTSVVVPSGACRTLETALSRRGFEVVTRTFLPGKMGVDISW